MNNGILQDAAATLQSGGMSNVVLSQGTPGMGHNGGPSLDDKSSNDGGKPPVGPGIWGFLEWRAKQTYEDAPYHTTGNSVKNPKPTNPDIAFDNSYAMTLPPSFIEF